MKDISLISMGKWRIVLGVLLVCMGAGEKVAAQALPVPEGRRLREIVRAKYPEGNLLVGATTGSWGFTNPIGEIMDREYSYVTPENDFKQAVIRNDPDSWNWSRADAWLPHILDHKQVLRIHGPISPQCSKWAKEDLRTAEELSRELDTFMTALCQRYNGVAGIGYLDVVNEIALDDGSWFGARPGTDLWENPWVKIGLDNDPEQTPLYIRQAFGIANEHAPDLKQIVNNHCHPGTAGMEKVKETILYLRERGYRVDGLGWQAHVDVAWPSEENLQHLRELIDWCKAQNLEFHITELDVYIYSYYTQILEKQAKAYKDIMDVVVEKVDGMTIGWNMWHISDASGWQPERKPAIFDDQYRPKRSYYELQLALETKGDYATLREVTFQFKNRESNEAMEACEVTLNGTTLYSDQNGEVTFQGISADRYTLMAKKEHMEELRTGVSIYQDTLITLWMDRALYEVKFHVTDLKSGLNLSQVELAIDTLILSTDLAGKASGKLYEGIYPLHFSKTGFRELQLETHVLSDTALEIQMEKTHGQIKFRVKSDQTPVNEAMIILHEDTLFTNGTGVCTFELLPLQQAYKWSASKTYFSPLSGEVLLETDSTIEIQLARSVAHLEFRLDASCLDAIHPLLRLEHDSVWFNDEGKAKLYNIALHQELSFTVSSDNYPDLNGHLFVEKDSTLHIFLAHTEVTEYKVFENIQIFPNPASDILHIRSSEQAISVELINSLGVPVKRFKPYTSSIQLSVKEHPPGIYWLKVNSPDGIMKIRAVVIE